MPGPFIALGQLTGGQELRTMFPVGVGVAIGIGIEFRKFTSSILAVRLRIFDADSDPDADSEQSICRHNQTHLRVNQLRINPLQTSG